MNLNNDFFDYSFIEKDLFNDDNHSLDLYNNLSSFWNTHISLNNPSIFDDCLSNDNSFHEEIPCCNNIENRGNIIPEQISPIKSLQVYESKEIQFESVGNQNITELALKENSTIVENKENCVERRECRKGFRKRASSEIQSNETKKYCQTLNPRRKEAIFSRIFNTINKYIIREFINCKKYDFNLPLYEDFGRKILNQPKCIKQNISINLLDYIKNKCYFPDKPGKPERLKQNFSILLKLSKLEIDRLRDTTIVSLFPKHQEEFKIILLNTKRQCDFQLLKYYNEFLKLIEVGN